MKNPLLTHFLDLVMHRVLRLSAACIMLWMIAMNVAQGQSPTIIQQCYCLNNATTATNGQYEDIIELNTGVTGQVWRLGSPISGFYNPASQPPPATPILYLNNTLIPEVSPGLYRIRGLRVSGQSWTLRIVNGTTGQVFTVNSTQSCSYPNFAVSGDVDVCRNTSETYSIPAGTYSSLAWTLLSGGSISSGQGTNSISVLWGPTPGRYSMGVTGVHSSYAGQARGCNFSLTKVVDVEDIADYTTIRGDDGNCIGARETYTIGATATQLSGVTWTIATVSGPVMPTTPPAIPGNSVNKQTIQWPSTSGVYDLTVAGNFTIPGTNNTCAFTNTMRVYIVSQPVVAMACNDLVQLSMNPNCQLTFTADQFLEDQVYPDHSYDIIIRDIEEDTIVPNGTLGYGYINKTLEIKVVHECSGNSCWGYAKIEDKSIPDLVCPGNITVNCSNVGLLSVTGYPVLPPGATRTPVAGKTNTWLLQGFDRCSDAYLTYTDAAQTDLCTGPYSSIITRTWKVTDETGNTSTCQQTINVNRANINDVVFPGSWDDVTGPNPGLEACGPWTKIADGDYKGNPSPDYTGWPSGTLCLKATVSFYDVKLPVCPNNPVTYKLVRYWKVIDHCTGTIREATQFITVMDTSRPVVTCPEDSRNQQNPNDPTPAATIYTSAHTCGGEWKVVPPIIINDCSATTWKVEFLLADNNGNPPVNGNYVTKSGNVEVTGSYPNYTIKNLPSGQTWIRYTVTDLCGNYEYCFTEVRVVDDQPPTPVCDKNSIVALGQNCIGDASVWTFDDGSHDNCELVCLKVRRMDNPVDWESLDCYNTIRFTGNDMGKQIMVELYARDKAGLSNTCMVEARVQDNIAPSLTVPGPANANCYEDFTSLTRFGSATATDNCTVTVRDSVVRNLNECGLGTITRWFIATDKFGNSVKKSQVITVGNNRAFGNGNIDWPDTYTTNVRCTADVDPDDLSYPYDKPRFTGNTECAQLAASHEDIVFNFADNVCVKILRKWTVVDWCQKNPFIPGSGEWSYTQLIMLNNTDAPDFLKGCSPADLTISQVGECRANVKVTAVAEDDCTPDEKLEWTYSIDEGNNGSVEVSNASGNSVNRDFPYGTHKITWTVKDGCKNVKTCPNIFTISDTKKPTPVCRSEVVTVIMPVAREVVIWASDFITNSTFDNCSPFSQITASFSGTNRNDISRTVRCSDMGGLTTKDFTYNVYAIDAAGNSDFCTVTLRVQDNNNACGNGAGGGTGQRLAISGSIYNESDEIVQDVAVELGSQQTEFPRSVNTGTDGRFSFAELPMYENYKITPGKNDDLLNGVSTLDLVMIQRHILGLTALESPYKIIAADVNNSQKVTAADLLELRKVVLGIQTEFTNNTSWRFVDVAYQFADPANPFPFAENTSMEALDHSVAGLDFIAVKVGDVNGSAISNARSGAQTGSRSIMGLTTHTITGKAGELVEVTINADEITSLVGMQMTLGWDTRLGEVVEVTSDVLSLKDENLGMQHVSDGAMHLSWNNQNPMAVHNRLLTVKIKLRANVTDTQLITLGDRGLSPEIYTLEAGQLKASAIRLNVEGREQQSAERFEVFQNVPNPFNAGTTIGFTLPQAGKVTLKVFDVTGKLMYLTSGQYNKGYNSFSLDANTLNLHGVLYYQIETGTDSATRKMIIIH